MNKEELLKQIEVAEQKDKLYQEGKWFKHKNYEKYVKKYNDDFCMVIMENFISIIKYENDYFFGEPYLEIINDIRPLQITFNSLKEKINEVEKIIEEDCK